MRCSPEKLFAAASCARSLSIGQKPLGLNFSILVLNRRVIVTWRKIRERTPLGEIPPMLSPIPQRDHTGLRRCFFIPMACSRTLRCKNRQGRRCPPLPPKRSQRNLSLRKTSRLLLVELVFPRQLDIAGWCHPCCTFCEIPRRKRSSALHTARSYKFGISELGPHRPTAVRSSLRQPSWGAHAGKTP